MSKASVEQVASALLYEGYMLYPYRRSALKNRQRFNFGVVYPRDYNAAQGGTDPWEMQTECLLVGDSESRIDITVRFLHLFERAPAQPSDPAWHDAIERDVTVQATRRELLATPGAVGFEFAAGEAPGRQVALRGRVDLGAEPAAPGADRVRVAIANLTPVDRTANRDEVMLHSLVSAHTILRTTGGGEFVSLTDPPPALKAAAKACRNIGTWPVLAGEGESRNTVLSSPIIVADFPSIAPESPGEFFDGTEIDEMLSLRILTLTDEEKREMAASDERVRQLLERTEAFDEQQLLRMHGVLREIRGLEEAP